MLGARGLLHEALPLDDDPGDPAGRDEPAAPSLTETRNVSRRPSTDSSVASACDLAADGGRREVVELHPVARRSCCRSPSSPAIASTVASSASGTTRGVASTGDVTAAERDGGVVVGDDHASTVAGQAGRRRCAIRPVP